MIKEAYDAGAAQALIDAGVIKEAAKASLLRTMAGVPALVGSGVGAGIGAIGGGLSNDGSVAGGALKGGLVGAGVGAGAGLGLAGGGRLGEMFGKWRGTRGLITTIRESGRYSAKPKAKDVAKYLSARQQAALSRYKQEILKGGDKKKMEALKAKAEALKEKVMGKMEKEKAKPLAGKLMAAAEKKNSKGAINALARGKGQSDIAYSTRASHATRLKRLLGGGILGLGGGAALGGTAGAAAGNTLVD